MPRLHKTRNIDKLGFWNKTLKKSGSKGEGSDNGYSTCSVRILGASKLLASDMDTGTSDPQCFVWLGWYSAEDEAKELKVKGKKRSYASEDETSVFARANFGVDERDEEYWDNLGVLRGKTVPHTCDPRWPGEDGGGESFEFAVPELTNADDLMRYRIVVYVRDEDIASTSKLVDIVSHMLSPEMMPETLLLDEGHGQGDSSKALMSELNKRDKWWTTTFDALDQLGWKESIPSDAVDQDADASRIVLAPWAEVVYLENNHRKTTGDIDLVEGRDWFRDNWVGRSDLIAFIKRRGVYPTIQGEVGDDEDFPSGEFPYPHFTKPATKTTYDELGRVTVRLADVIQAGTLIPDGVVQTARYIDVEKVPGMVRVDGQLQISVALTFHKDDMNRIMQTECEKEPRLAAALSEDEKQRLWRKMKAPAVPPFRRVLEMFRKEGVFRKGGRLDLASDSALSQLTASFRPSSAGPPTPTRKLASARDRGGSRVLATPARPSSSRALARSMDGSAFNLLGFPAGAGAGVGAYGTGMGMGMPISPLQEDGDILDRFGDDDGAAYARASTMAAAADKAVLAGRRRSATLSIVLGYLVVAFNGEHDASSSSLPVTAPPAYDADAPADAAAGEGEGGDAAPDPDPESVHPADEGGLGQGKEEGEAEGEGGQKEEEKVGEADATAKPPLPLASKSQDRFSVGGQIVHALSARLVVGSAPPLRGKARRMKPPAAEGEGEEEGVRGPKNSEKITPYGYELTWTGPEMGLANAMSDSYSALTRSQAGAEDGIAQGIVELWATVGDGDDEGEILIAKAAIGIPVVASQDKDYELPTLEAVLSPEALKMGSLKAGCVTLTAAAILNALPSPSPSEQALALEKEASATAAATVPQSDYGFPPGPLPLLGGGDELLPPGDPKASASPTRDTKDKDKDRDKERDRDDSSVISGGGSSAARILREMARQQRESLSASQAQMGQMMQFAATIANIGQMTKRLEELETRVRATADAVLDGSSKRNRKGHDSLSDIEDKDSDASDERLQRLAKKNFKRSQGQSKGKSSGKYNPNPTRAPFKKPARSEVGANFGVQIYEKRCGEVVLSKGDGAGQMISASLPNADSSLDIDRATELAPPGSPLSRLAPGANVVGTEHGPELKGILKKPMSQFAGYGPSSMSVNTGIGGGGLGQGGYGGGGGLGLGSMAAIGMGPMSPGAYGHSQPTGLDWDAIGGALAQGEYGLAFEEVLSKGNLDDLARAMENTGPRPELLSVSLRNRTYDGIATMLVRGHHIERSLVWVLALVRGRMIVDMVSHTQSALAAALARVAQEPSKRGLLAAMLEEGIKRGRDV